MRYNLFVELKFRFLDFRQALSVTRNVEFCKQSFKIVDRLACPRSLLYERTDAGRLAWISRVHTSTLLLLFYPIHPTDGMDELMKQAIVAVGAADRRERPDRARATSPRPQRLFACFSLIGTELIAVVYCVDYRRSSLRRVRVIGRPAPEAGHAPASISVTGHRRPTNPVTGVL
ncbi:hypothetical protein EVAR_6624_1 [Eumeta japonica]|uniref:Uncharacterized protein n=1 Tax=Eumeta variegata TaxID=151549 RepID=A0A4C1TKE6_EUMVA|nr:hypothetical protein EVAR_6624_1 [Eumeta japonica]